MESFKIGSKFSSCDEFYINLTNYLKENFSDFSVVDSRTLDKAKKRYASPRIQNAPPELKYYYIKYSCVHGGLYERNSKIVIRNSSTKKMECPAMIFLALSDDGKSLEVKKLIESHNHEITKKSDKKPRDPATLCSDRLFEPLVILQEGSNLYRPKSPQPIILHVRPIAPKKVKKLYPCPEPDATEAQVTKESENQPREYPITLQEPCAESIPMGEVRLIKELEEQPQDIEEFALRNAIDGLSSNELKAPATSKDSKSALEAPVTADGATNSMMNFNMVCPHCQKACKVCLSIKHQLLKTNSKGSFQTETDQEIRKLKERQLKEQVLRLKKDNLWMRKKVKALEQRNRRLKAKNERLQLKEGNEEGLMVIGTVNGVLNKKDL